jgi:ribose transport system permease protein
MSSADTYAGAAAPTPGGILAKAWRATRRFRPVLVLLVLLFVVMSITQANFFTSENIENMLTSVSVIWVVALGMTFVVISAGIDLSVGAVAAISGIFLAKLLGTGMPGGVVLALTLLFGVLVGAALNGILVGRFGLPVFVVTLASMTTLTGLVNIWSGSQSFYVTAPIVSQITFDNIFGIPAAIWIMALTLIVALYVQSRTYFGRDVYAVGGSIVAARLSGIRTSLTLIAIYGISGGAAALGGALAVGRIGAATPQVENNLPLQAIAAVLLGGTALSGGVGGVGGTALGVLFIGVLQNGLGIAGVSSFWQQVVTGVILVAAVFGSGNTGVNLDALRGLGRGNKQLEPTGEQE